MEFTDYLNRKIGLFKQTFNTHTKGKYLNESEQRHKLFPIINNILKNPDEVWLTFNSTKKIIEARYIKLYKNKSIVVFMNIDNKYGHELKTWFQIKADETKIKKGLLINK